METKVCSVCGEKKSISEFYHQKTNRCKPCTLEKEKEYRLTEGYIKKRKEYEKKRLKTEKYKERVRGYRKSERYREKERERNRKRYRRNGNRPKSKASRERHTEYLRKQREELGDIYVVSIIRHGYPELSVKEIYNQPELIEEKRSIVYLKRLLKQLKQHENETS